MENLISEDCSMFVSKKETESKNTEMKNLVELTSPQSIEAKTITENDLKELEEKVSKAI